MYPPDDPYIVRQLFGFLTIRWYAVLILGGAMLAAWFGARRVAARGYDPDHAWNLLALGLVTSIAFARAWYVFFEWERFAAQRANYDSTWQWLLFDVANPATGGIAIQGAIIGAVLGCYIYTKRNGLDFVEWLDLGAPAMLIGQAIGRWGNFFNQEAYGRPMDPPQPWGLRIDAPYRIHEYTDLATYPVDTTRFHPTFLYESVWNALALVALLTIEQRLRGWLRKGDVFLLYGILYSTGRFFIEGLRTDSLCVGAVGGSCADGLRMAQLTALVTIVVFGLIFAFRHLRRASSPQPAPQDR
jgi:phosphatidylglycerol:prolipoprotein diacylglycerol transferase